HFDREDIIFTKEFAHRAAMAIENARLYKEAQQVITSKNDFIAMVSHELKTPVTSLKIYMQILEKKLDSVHKGERKQFEKMENQLDQLTSLIDELLDFSRIQRKKLVYHKEIFVIGGLVQDITRTMQQSTDTHKIILQGTSSK